MPIEHLPDAEAQCQALAEQIRPQLTADTHFVGIYSGGVWVAERVAQLLQVKTEGGQIDVSFYRDDYEKIGLHPNVRPTSIPFDVEGKHIILFDDVLQSGRTTRAALNVLFDFGRPAKVELAVLADRGERELPVCAAYKVWDVSLTRQENLILEKTGEAAESETAPLAWQLGSRA